MEFINFLPLERGGEEGLIIDMKRKIHNFSEYKELRKNLRNDPTIAERVLWKELCGKKLGGYKFRRQQSIDNYIVDFYCASKKIIIEVYGYIHGEEENIKKDKIRQDHLENFGFLVLRYRNEQLKYELESVLQDIFNHCEERVDHP